MEDNLNEYRFLINSQKLENQKSHDLYIQLNREFSNCVDVKIVNVTLCNSFYNISSELKNNYFEYRDVKTNTTKYITLEDGLYNIGSYMHFVNKKFNRNPFKISISSETGKLKIRFPPDIYNLIIRKNLFEMFGIKSNNTYILDSSGRFVSEKPAQMLPFTHFNIYSNLIDYTKNIEAGNNTSSNSGLLTVLPLKGVKEFGTQINYNLSECDFKPCISKFNSIVLKILDHNGNPIDLNNFPVTYEIVVRCRK